MLAIGKFADFAKIAVLLAMIVFFQGCGPVFKAAEDTAAASSPQQSANSLDNHSLKPGYVMVGDMAVHLSQVIPEDQVKFWPAAAARLKSQGKVLHQGVKSHSVRHWPNGVLPIVFHGNVSQQMREKFFANCYELTKAANVRCVGRTTQQDYVLVFTDNINGNGGGWSNLGLVGGQNQMGLGSDADSTTIQHELFHALGFSHEHSSTIRDNHITIVYSRIPAQQHYNFARVTGAAWHTNYDFKSIMHYSSGTLSSWESPVIVANSPLTIAPNSCGTAYHPLCGSGGQSQLVPVNFVMSDLDKNSLTAFYGASLIVPLRILTQPQAVTLNQGQSFTLQVSAQGHGSLMYEWSRNGRAIANSNSATFRVANAKADDAGTYRVKVSDANGSTDSAAAEVTVIVPPTIVTSPMSQTVAPGTPVALTVATLGTQPMQYQWRKNGVNIAGAQGQTYPIPSPVVEDSGDYSVIVSNPAGTATSEVAVLRVIIPPRIVTQPMSQRITVGQNVELNVQVVGTPPFSYQWLKDGQEIAGATTGSLTISQIMLEQAGQYQVRVSNPTGNALSAGADIDVLYPPRFTTQPGVLLVEVGEAATLLVAAEGNPSAMTYQWFWVNPITQVESLLTGETTTQLNLMNVQAAQRGRYFVRATNEVGTTESQPGAINVKGVNREPAEVELGSSGKFSVQRTGGFDE